MGKVEREKEGKGREGKGNGEKKKSDGRRKRRDGKEGKGRLKEEREADGGGLAEWGGGKGSGKRVPEWHGMVLSLFGAASAWWEGEGWSR